MLSAEDLEFQMVQNHFLKNLPKDSQTEITSVEFVTNPALQQKYEDKKSEFQTNGIPDEEIFAYHGNLIFYKETSSKRISTSKCDTY